MHKNIMFCCIIFSNPSFTMRILHVTAGIQETCGVSRFVMETARAQIAAGHEVCVVTSMTCGYPVGDMDVRLTQNPASIEFTPDIVHLHSIWNMYVHKMAAWSRRRNIPYVISPHGALTSWALRYKWWKKLPALLLYQYRDLQKASAFHVTVQEEEKDIRHLKLKQPVAVAPLGVDLLPEISISTPYKDILFLGRIHPVKNLDSLFRAWADISQSERKGWRLIIAGPDDIGHQQELKELAESLELSVRDFSKELAFGKKQIHGGGEVPLSIYQEKLAETDADVVFPGPVYSDTKDWLYQEARFFVLPSHSENFGAVILEALAGGTPCIATKGTPWSQLPENNCGWWVDDSAEALKNAIQTVLALDAVNYASMSSNSRSFVAQNYSWKTSAELLLEAYKSAIV